MSWRSLIWGFWTSDVKLYEYRIWRKNILKLDFQFFFTDGKIAPNIFHSDLFLWSWMFLHFCRLWILNCMNTLGQDQYFALFAFLNELINHQSNKSVLAVKQSLLSVCLWFSLPKNWLGFMFKRRKKKKKNTAWSKNFVIHLANKKPLKSYESIAENRKYVKSNFHEIFHQYFSFYSNWT